MNILVVDDETMLIDSITIGLTNNGYQVFAAPNAQQALEQLSSQNQKIDLVITDYLMPGMNGLELLVAIRGSHPTLPVMIMTAYTETRLVIEALKNHCDGFISKPFRLDQLIAEIERIKLNLLQNTKSSDLHQILPRIVHQINNPLVAISGLSELIRRNLGKDIDLQKWFDGILDAVKQISRINKDIINAGRMEVSKCEPIELDTLLDDCLEMFESLFLLKGVLVKKKIPMHGLHVMGNRFSLEQIFNNLILNAVDAMDGRTEKKISVTITLLPDFTSVEIAIEDTGCGIREELLAKIFEPYFTDKRNGNGLGLEIIKNVVEKHGGKVLVESQVGRGTRFSVHLPIMQMAELEVALPPGDEKRVGDMCMSAS